MKMSPVPIDEVYDVAIVGGGPAGISAAWELRGSKIMLLEKLDRLGGRLHSIQRGNYWLNLGAHLFPQLGSRIRQLTSDLGLEVVDIPGNKAAIWFAGSVYAPKSPTFMPLILPLTLLERLSLSLLGIRILRVVNRWRKANVLLDGETTAARRERVARFMSRTSFRQFLGRPVGRVDALFEAAGRRASVDIEDQSAGVGVSLFGAVWGGKRSTIALNLMGGSGRLGEEVEKALVGKITNNANVTEVDNVGALVRVTYEQDGDTKTLHAKQVICTLPAFIAAEVVKSIPSNVRETLRNVQYGAFVSMAVLTDEVGPMPWDNIYAITTPGASFDMLFNHANPLRAKSSNREAGGSFMVYSGGRAAKDLLSTSDSEIEAKFLDDFYKVFPQLVGHVKETKIAKWVPGNSCRSVDFDFSPMINYCGRNDTSIHFAGDYFAEIGNMEVAASSAYEAAVRAKSRLERRNTKPS